MEPGEIVGTTLVDRSGNGHDGVIIGSPAPVLSPGQLGDALDFTATNGSYVDVETMPFDSSSTGATTVTLWYFRSSTTSTPNDVIVDLPPPATSRYDLWLTNQSLCFNTQQNECWGVTGGNLFDRWVYVAAIFRNGLETTSELYVDSTAQVAVCTLAACNTSRTVLAPFHLGGSDTFHLLGLLDDVRVWNRALTADEITAVGTGTVTVCP
jgi:hypothetical protein